MQKADCIECESRVHSAIVNGNKVKQLKRTSNNTKKAIKQPATHTRKEISAPAACTGLANHMKDVDVSCEKGRGPHERREGNKLYRRMIDLYKVRYVRMAPIERSEIISKILQEIKGKGGWFVEPSERGSSSGIYMTDDKVRKKVSDDLTRAARRPRESRAAELTRKRQVREKQKKIRKEKERHSSDLDIALSRRQNQLAVRSSLGKENCPMIPK